jgi:DNA-binding LytR/AlgR family response regulator
LTDNVTKAISILESEESSDMIAAKKGSDIALLQFSDIYMFRVEDKQVNAYTQNNVYIIKKPLYQVEESLNGDFVRISKTTIVNLKKIQRVAPSLRGMMFIELKNGLKDNISRKYLPDFKRALDL